MTAAVAEREVAAVRLPQSSPQSPAVDPPAAAPPPAPKRVKHRPYNGFLDSPERVKELKRVMPRKVPRLRDLQIYEYVVFQQMSQYDVAQIFDLTQPRVCQIVQEVRAWKSTVAWEFPGMTGEQQMNLATHETRRWLEVIRDKSLAAHDQTAAQQETVRTSENAGGFTGRNTTLQSQPPRPGFLNIALKAVLKAGELGGAGEQWRQCRMQSAECSVEQEDPCGVRSAECGVEEEMTNDQVPTTNEISKPDSGAGTVDSGRAPGDLLKKNRSNFSPQNGKANGHKVSDGPGSAQVEKSRRRQARQSAYQLAADRQGISPASRKFFFQLLRQLDSAALRVEHQAQQRVARDAKRGIEIDDDWLACFRENLLRKLLRLDRRIQPIRYGHDWVLKQYDATTGRFRWSPNGPPATAPESPPEEQKPPNASQGS
ncbi:MAG TPA: hypothetical protein VMP01_12655 [Pirellulaceae bacterium]|nr:hypothetical protein [Pirellulaceae bacterium]